MNKPDIYARLSLRKKPKLGLIFDMAGNKVSLRFCLFERSFDIV